MKDKRKLTITIGTSVFNEEQNIREMLRSICTQMQKTVEIKKIIVLSDGSTDQTVRNAKLIGDRRIEVIDDGKRYGQPARIRQMLESLTTDILVLLDGDMVLKHAFVIEEIGKLISHDPRIGLITGRVEPVGAETLIEHAVNNYRVAREKFYPNYVSTAYAAHAFLVYTKQFAGQVGLTGSELNPDAFSYFSCKKQGFRIAYDARIAALYRSPQSAHDVVNQSVRHRAGGQQLYDYFDREVVESEFYIPWRVKINMMLWQLYKNPFGYIALRTVILFGQIRNQLSNSSVSVLWTPIMSSKHVV
ncbi:glycosyltransferase [Candidatus Roizmanbacteria bacterium]|nr:glycosyltransferase [Candidatus Roizmanbacteria bacterium]